ncbi:hypothetical protein LMG18096_01243 [Ralstonia holmesii]|uniref:Uncharacterized protein n=1 Tax=Ralstonia holmesii TaxID=3058602 RepID=A0ABC8Q9P2_9RALS|nr:hypothetical protein LMG18096_01243 [Ralstonia sp. LMG 32967]CAJ0817582.1 hypothetical protein LMG18093_03406 [Ralstonia sp. LMG 32967]
MQMGSFFCACCSTLNWGCPNKKAVQFALNGFVFVAADQAEGGGT